MLVLVDDLQWVDPGVVGGTDPGVDSCVNGEVLLSCEATAAAGQPLATVARVRAASGYGRR